MENGEQEEPEREEEEEDEAKASRRQPDAGIPLARATMLERPRPVFPDPPREGLSDKIINFLRNNRVVMFLYTGLTDAVVPFVLAVVIVVPVGVALLLFFLPKFFRNRRRRRQYGVKVIPASSATSRTTTKT
jgi:hypothetical protein